MKVNTTLQTLQLIDNQIGAEGAMALAQALKVNTTLQILELDVNEIRAEGATALAEALKVNTILQSLLLDCNQIGDEGAMALADALKVNTALQTLQLGGNEIGDKDATALANALKVNTTLQTLSLDANEIRAEGATALAEALKVNTTLQTLELGFTQIGGEGATPLAEALKVNTTLRTLLLQNNQIGDEGATALAESLKVNTTLQTLQLGGNEIGDKGATALANALKVNTTLQTLSLDSKHHYCEIGDKGATALAEALKVNTTLQTLSLDSHRIGDEGATALAEALKVNTTLQTLWLYNNRIGDEGATALAVALKVNTTLRELWLTGNNISEVLYRLIALLLKQERSVPYDATRPQHFMEIPAATSITSPFQPSRRQQVEEAVQQVLTTDRTSVRKVLVDYEAEPAELSSAYFELVLDVKVSVSTGVFGEVFLFKDVDLGKQFAVKTMKLGLDNEQREFVRKTLAEIQMLHRFRHPNIVRMYGYHLSTQEEGRIQYLLYEFGSQGSLESMLKTEEGRKVLTFPRRLRILLGVAQGLNFLHTGIQLDHNQSSAGKTKEPAVHRDVKSANICIESTFGAKLMDCGLGELVAKDSKVLKSIAASAQLSSDETQPIGTHAYRDPGYTDGDYEYGNFCDVFSFGVVMAELFTGTLSGMSSTTGGSGGGNSDTRTIYSKYVKKRKKRRPLREDLDDLISDASPDLLDELSLMSLECMADEEDERPSAFHIVVRLQEMIMKVHCGGAGPNPDFGVTDDTGGPDGERCRICYRQTMLGLSCSDHFICAQCLPSHEGIDRGEGPLECMMEGCTKCYREDNVQKCLPAVMYKQYVLRRQWDMMYMQSFAKILVDKISKGWDDKFDRVVDKINCMEGKIDVALECIKDIQNNSDRALVALAYLATGEQTPCPKLVWIVPHKRKFKRGAKGMKDLFKDAFYQETAVYFLCENTYSQGHEDPIIMNFGRKWVKHLLPLVKLSLVTLRIAGVGTTGLPFPIPDLGFLEKFQYLEELVTGFLEELHEEHEESMRQTLEDMEEWVHDMVEKGESLMEGNRKARIKVLVGSSYEILSQKALKAENLPKWQHSMTAQFLYDDNRTKCKIKWVKM